MSTDDSELWGTRRSLLPRKWLSRFQPMLEKNSNVLRIAVVRQLFISFFLTSRRTSMIHRFLRRSEVNSYVWEQLFRFRINYQSRISSYVSNWMPVCITRVILTNPSEMKKKRTIAVLHETCVTKRDVLYSWGPIPHQPNSACSKTPSLSTDTLGCYCDSTSCEWPSWMSVVARAHVR